MQYILFALLIVIAAAFAIIVQKKGQEDSGASAGKGPAAAESGAV